MTLALDAALFVPALGLLWWGAESSVRGAAHLARRVGMSDFVIGATVLAMATSAPELVVTLIAAFQDRAGISVGNVVGSNVFNLGVILGVCALVWGVPSTRTQVFRDGSALVIASTVLLVCLWDLRLTWSDGAILLALGLTYVTVTLRSRSARDEANEELPAGLGDWTDFPRLAMGLIAVVVGSYLLVESAKSLAEAAGLSDWLIGSTIVAAGTSLPELATSLTAARHGHTGLLTGNLIGSDLFNVLIVLGLAALARPLGVGNDARIGVGIMLGAVLLLVLLMRRNWRLSRTEGAILIALAVARWSYEIFGAGAS